MALLHFRSTPLYLSPQSPAKSITRIPLMLFVPLILSVLVGLYGEGGESAIVGEAAVANGASGSSDTKPAPALKEKQRPNAEPEAEKDMGGLGVSSHVPKHHRFLPNAPFADASQVLNFFILHHHASNSLWLW